MKKLYRVVVKTTGSLQPSGTHWENQVLYCGYDREEAIRVYHESTPTDRWMGYGSRVRKTIGQSKGV